MTKNVVVGSGRGPEIGFLAVNRVCLRESPQNARVEDQSLVGLRIDDKIVCDLATEASKFIIDRVLQPKGKNVGSEFLFNSLLEV
jgi:hypothetical protein